MPEARQQPSSAQAPVKTGTAPGGSGASRPRASIAKKLLALVCLAAVTLVEYYLVNLPVGEVQDSKKFSPAEVDAASNFATFEHPESGGGFSFSFAQTESQGQKTLLDARLENAQLADETVQQLKRLGASPPLNAGKLSYLTSTVPGGSCSTKLDVTTTNPNPASVELMQDTNQLPDDMRQLVAKFTGTDATVTLLSAGEFEHGLSPCRVELSGSGWTQVIPGFIPVKMRAATGTEMRFQWQNINVSSLLKFGASSKDSFTAQAIEIGTLPGQTGQPVALRATSRHSSSPLTVKLVIGANQMEVTASGTGRVVENGKPVITTDALAAINKNPILSTMFGAANVALIGWVTRMFFPKRRKEEDD